MKTAYDKAKEYAEFIGFKFYDIAEQYYNGRNETLLIVYEDKEHKIELNIYDFTGD